jgi:hypothetical protein
MNRHQRRKAAKVPRRHKQPNARPTIIPDDLRRDIAQTVRDVEFVTDAPGGLCFYRAIIGREFLRSLDIAGDLCLGGMVYRAGPDPERDIVAFCGPGGVGQMIDGNLIGHYWIEYGRDIIDFSAGDWCGDMTPELALDLDPDDLSDLGPIQWDVEPPEYFWLPSKEARPIGGKAKPALGRPYYTGWAGAPPGLLSTALEEIETTLDWKALASHFRLYCQHYGLKERLSEVV